MTAAAAAADEVDVAVVGAGAAGIAAARALRESGLRCVLLEASARVGGRAYTDTASLGAPFDQGASWLHDAEHNPLTPIARRQGFTLHEEPGRRRRDILLVGDRPATQEERAAFEAAADAWEEAAERRASALAAAGDPDIPLADAVPRGGLWDATAAHWFGAMISGVEAWRFSLRDYASTSIAGRNPQVREGFGTLVARQAEGLSVTLGCPVERIATGGPGGFITVDGPRGRVRARGCIVTVSTGVLATGGIRFDPALPPEVEAAIAGLPQGLLTKIALRAAGPDRLDLPAFGRLGRRVEGDDDRPASWLLWPFGRDHAIGFIGGEAAWELAREGPRAADAFARAELARYFGAARVERAFRPCAVVTRWAEDPRFRGAYSHARVGQAGARAVLRDAAVADGRLRLAGEACHGRYAGTVGGAWESGLFAARALAETLGVRAPPPPSPPAGARGG
jgi:monoamine oxidase